MPVMLFAIDPLARHRDRVFLCGPLPRWPVESRSVTHGGTVKHRHDYQSDSPPLFFGLETHAHHKKIQFSKKMAKTSVKLLYLILLSEIL